MQDNSEIIDSCDFEQGEASIWVDEDGYIHIGDKEVSWKLNAMQAKVWAKGLWETAKEVESGGGDDV